MFFFEIGRDVEGIEVLEVLSMTYVVFAEPLGSRRQVLSEAVEYPRGRAPGRAKLAERLEREGSSRTPYTHMSINIEKVVYL